MESDFNEFDENFADRLIKELQNKKCPEYDVCEQIIQKSVELVRQLVKTKKDESIIENCLRVFSLLLLFFKSDFLPLMSALSEKYWLYLKLVSIHSTKLLNIAIKSKGHFEKFHSFFEKTYNPTKYLTQDGFREKEFEKNYHFLEPDSNFKKEFTDFLMSNKSILALARLNEGNPELSYDEIDFEKVQRHVKVIICHLFDKNNIAIAPFPSSAIALTIEPGILVISQNLWSEYTSKKTPDTKLKLFNYMGHEVAHLKVKSKINIDELVYEYKRTEESFKIPGGNYAESGEFYEQSLFGGRLNFKMIKESGTKYL